MGQLFFIGPTSTGTAGTVPTDFYLSAANGNDANDGLTPATPVVTIARAYALITSYLGGVGILNNSVVLHFSAGDYSYDGPPDFDFGDETLLIFYGDGAGQAGDDGFSVISSDITTGAGASGTEIVVAGPLPTNGLVGYSLRFHDAYEGYIRHVARNTATSIYFGAAISPTVPAGVNFDVVAPTVRISHSAVQQAVMNLGVGANLAFVNTIVNNSNGNSFGAATSSRILFFGTFFESFFSLVPTDCSFLGGTTGFVISPLNVLITALQNAVGLADINFWVGWGLTGVQANSPAFTTVVYTPAPSNQPSSYLGNCVGGISITAGCSVYMTGGALRYGNFVDCNLWLTGYVNVGTDGTITLRGTSTTLRPVTGQTVEAKDRNGLIFLLEFGATLWFFPVGTGRIEVETSSGAVIDASNNSTIRFQGNSFFTCTGTAQFIVARNSVAIFLASVLEADFSASSGIVVDLESGCAVNSDGTPNISGAALRIVDSVVESACDWTLTRDTDVLIVDGGSFRQTGGIFSAISSAASAAVVSRDGSVKMSGGASSVLTGAIYGLSCTGASKADFAGALSSVSGTTSDLHVDNSNVAAATLAAGGDFVTGLAAIGSPGMSGGSVIGRSA